MHLARVSVHGLVLLTLLVEIDLARADDQGYVTVVGRSTDLIISGGENIHPAEIENLATTWPGVAEAAVVGLPDDRWGEVPVLVLVARPGAPIDLDGLRAELERCLARFKQPRRIVLAEALPRTALGKVQKAALRQSLSAAAGAASVPGRLADSKAVDLGTGGQKNSSSVVD